MTSPKTLLRAWNLRPKKNLGQSFLCDPSIAASIVARARLSRQDVILEIGAGLGALTIPLARAVQKIYAIEKDRQLIDLLNTELVAHQIANCEIIAGDILKIDLNRFPESAGSKMTVVGNLPYNISSQVLVNLIGSRHNFARAIFMFQKELAQRIAAGPGGRDYGRITAMLRYCADIKTMVTVKANAFYPPPKVDSAVVEIKFKSTTGYPPHSESMLFTVIKASFGNRRKTLKNALKASGLGLDARAVEEVLSLAGVDPTRRAETLEPEEFVALTVGLEAVLKRSRE